VRVTKDYANTRYSSLDQINTGNVQNLKVAWTFQTGVSRGQEAAPIVADNTMYVVSPWPDKDVLIGPRFKPLYNSDKGTDLGVKTWPPDAWRIGGGTVWGFLAYDPDLNLIYYGTANPGPWNPEVRPGDNKWTAGMFARDADTGEAVWFYQMSPHDLYDWDGINEDILLDLPLAGQYAQGAISIRAQWSGRRTRDPPDLFWGTLNLCIFIASVVPNEWYRRSARKGDTPSRPHRTRHPQLRRYPQRHRAWLRASPPEHRLEHRRLRLCRVDPRGPSRHPPAYRSRRYRGAHRPVLPKGPD
jgi:hypothetical protein